MLERVQKVAVFTTDPRKGNLAGVVQQADDLSSEEMQDIARQVGLSETVFCLTSCVADIRLRFFMPEKETPLCGHGTLGAVWLNLKTKGELKSKSLTVETEAGILKLSYDAQSNNVTMAQQAYQSRSYEGDISQLCQVLGIEKEELKPDLPLEYGSTGVWTLLVPVKDAQSLSRMNPDNQEFPSVLKEFPEASIHPYTPSQKAGVDYEARHFSSATAGVKEDSVTGTASGSMVGSLAEANQLENLELVIEQGASLEKEGRVRARYEKGETACSSTITIAGTCCVMK